MKLIRKRKETLMKEANYAISQDRSQHTLFLIRRLSVYILMDCVTIYSVCHLQLIYYPFSYCLMDKSIGSDFILNRVIANRNNFSHLQNESHRFYEHCNKYKK